MNTYLIGLKYILRFMQKAIQIFRINTKLLLNYEFVKFHYFSLQSLS